MHKTDDMFLGATYHRFCASMLSETTITDLQKILLEEFGFECDKKSADEIATSLVAFTETLIEINNESTCQNTNIQ